MFKEIRKKKNLVLILFVLLLPAVKHVNIMAENRKDIMQANKELNEEENSYEIKEGYDNTNWLSGSNEGLEFYFSNSENDQKAKENFAYISIDLSI